MTLQKLLSPVSTVIVGASSRPAGPGYSVWGATRRSGGLSTLIPVNPKYETLDGYSCVKDIRQLREPVDAVQICIGPEKAAGTIEHVSGLSCSLMILHSPASAGWQSQTAEKRLRDWKARTGGRIIGPGAAGIMLPGQKLNLSVWEELPKPGNIALITQTRAIASVMLDDTRGTELGFSAVISTGAECDLSQAELIEHFAADKNTRVIAVELCRIRDPRRLFSALKQASRHKRVVVFSTYLSLREHPLLESILRQAQVWLTGTLEEFVAVTSTLATNRLPRGNRLCVATLGESIGEWAVSQFSGQGAALSRLSAQTLEKLRQSGITEAIENPLVLPGSLEQALKALPVLLEDDSTDALLLIVPPTGGESAPLALGQLIKNTTGSQKPILSVWLSDRNARAMRGGLSQTLNTPLSVFTSVGIACKVFAALVEQTRHRTQRHEVLLDRPRIRDTATIRDIRLLVMSSLEKRKFTMELPQSRMLVEKLGLTNTPLWVCQSTEDILTQAGTLGWPLWVKLRAKGFENLIPPAVYYHPEEIRHAWQEAHRRISALSLGEPKLIAHVQRYIPHSARALEVTLERSALTGPYLQLGGGAPDATLPLQIPFRFREAVDRLKELDLPSEVSAAGRFQLAESLSRISDAVACIPALEKMVLHIVTDHGKWVVRDSLISLCQDAAQADDQYSHLLLPPSPLEAETTLMAGPSEVTLRPLLDGDFAALRAFLERLSEKSLYLRFHTRAKLTPQRIAQVYDHDPIRESAWVIESAGEIHAFANWHQSAEDSEAEFGIVVEDAWQRRGLARALMNTLIDTARRRGIFRLVGYVLKGNEAMRMTMIHLGFSKQPGESADTETWSFNISYNPEQTSD